jgi:hypothetical protein
MDPFGLFDPVAADQLAGGLPGADLGGTAAQPDGLWVSAADGWHDLAAVDVDGDGLADTGAWETEQGTAVFTDLDADGVADLCQQIRPDGTFATWTFDGDRWHLLDSGDLS